MFHSYPYTDFHELNNDWLIAEWKEFLNKYVDLTGRVENVEKLIAEYKEYMDNYFDNLDVTTEINNKIDQMIADGQFATILANFLPFVTPEMYGATGDGVTDDTQAFITMAAANIPVYIPNKTYAIDRQVFINKLIGDFGSYPNYEPLYKRDINVDLGGISRGEDTALPVTTSYVEAVTYMNNMYYMACYDYSNTATYIARYNADFEYIDKYYTSGTYGIANSIFNDGAYIWVDYDSGYHVRFSPDIASATAFYNPTIRNYGYWNKTYYAVEFGVGEITIAELESDMIATRNAFTIQADYGTLQSASVLNGVIYIPTTQGNFYVIDIATHDFNRISYMDQLEIENFFIDKAGVLSGSGHYYGMNGMYNIYRFNGGVPDVPFRYISADGTYNIANIYTAAADRTGVYHITNGTNAGFPYDEGDLFITNDLKLFVCNAINSKYVYRGNAWRWGGTINRELITLGSGIRLVLGQGGEIIGSFSNYHATSNVNTYTNDLSDLYARLQLPNNYSMSCYVIGKAAGNIISVNVFIGSLNINRTSQALYLRNITGSGIDCYIDSEFFMLQLPN